jgi:hypothetical protein
MNDQIGSCDPYSKEGDSPGRIRLRVRHVRHPAIGRATQCHKSNAIYNQPKRALLFMAPSTTFAYAKR